MMSSTKALPVKPKSAKSKKPEVETTTGKGVQAHRKERPHTGPNVAQEPEKVKKESVNGKPVPDYKNGTRHVKSANKTGNATPTTTDNRDSKKKVEKSIQESRNRKTNGNQQKNRLSEKSGCESKKVHNGLEGQECVVAIPKTLGENKIGNVEKKNTQDEECMENDKLKNYQIQNSFSCFAENDVTTPWLSGIACVKNGDILCLDLNNGNLKRFDKNLNFVSSIEVPFDSAGIVQTSDEEVAVTCLNEVHFYNIGKFGMNRLSKYYKIAGITCGIAHDRTWLALTCDIHDDTGSTIQIIDDDGKQQHLIKPEEVSGLHVKLSGFIELDYLKQQVFISDSASSRIISYSFSGEVLWELSIPGGARGITSVHTELLLISDQFSGHIRLITKSGVNKSILLTSDDGVCNPDYITFCPESERVFISYAAFGVLGVFHAQFYNTKD